MNSKGMSSKYATSIPFSLGSTEPKIATTNVELRHSSLSSHHEEVTMPSSFIVDNAHDQIMVC